MFPQRNGERKSAKRSKKDMSRNIYAWSEQGVNKPRMEGRRPESSRDGESNGSRTCGSNFLPRDLNPAAKVGVPINLRSRHE
ncbi:hypothetical protein PoB_004318600 [Plakobranchus ocellatus]|uniref:Uncharacterized protein n=1 Tax=Plakobranchus ocellatus TaxID=259542 RepID=A0AAV4BCZ5_9GAST|nr:hypothetical protein PoB_004318600 [Plakobranchus ocellatus]